LKESLVDAMTFWLSSKLEDVHTAIPGKIEKYDEATKTADVLPSLSKITVKNVEVALPVIPGVPIIFPSGKAFELSWEVQKGDGVLLIFSEAALGAWVDSDGSKQITPEGKHRFSETDAIAILGLSSKVVDSALKMYIDKTGKMTIGSGSSPFVKGDALEILLNNFLNILSSIVPGDVTANAAALTAIKGAATAALIEVPGTKSVKVSAE